VHINLLEYGSLLSYTPLDFSETSPEIQNANDVMYAIKNDNFIEDQCWLRTGLREQFKKT